MSPRLPAFLGLLILLVSMIVLGRLEARGVTHADLQLDDGTPATLYLPGKTIEHWLLPDPLPENERPPGVVITHALGADRATMSTLARRLARNGYAVLALDLPGHGTNRNPFPVGRGRRDLLRPTLDEALDYLVRSGYARADRLALVGHSVGAIGVLDYAAGSDRIGATILMSVGLIDAKQPPVRNLLLLYAAWDSTWMSQSAQRLAARQAGVRNLPPGTTHGDPADGTGVRVQRVPLAEHFAVAVSRPAAAEIVSWLDRSFGMERTGAPDLSDPRWIPFLLASAAGIVLLFGLGDLLGSLAPGTDEDRTGGSARALLLLSGVFAVTLPVLSTGERLAWFVGLEVLDTLLPQLALMGGLIFVCGFLRPGTLPAIPSKGRGRSMAVALLGAALVYAALAPISVVVHRLTPTPERLLSFALVFPLLLLFFLALDLLLRRGAPLRAGLLSIAGRAVMVVAWIVGVELRIVPPLTVVIAPLFLLLLLPLELVAWRIYRRSGNRLVTAAFESLVFGWLCTMLLPLRM